MSEVFPIIQKNEQKAQEKAMQDKIKQIEGHADDLIKLLKEKDLELGDAVMVLQATGKRLNLEGSKVKLSSVFI